MIEFSSIANTRTVGGGDGRTSKSEAIVPDNDQVDTARATTTPTTVINVARESQVRARLVTTRHTVPVRVRVGFGAPAMRNTQYAIRRGPSGRGRCWQTSPYAARVAKIAVSVDIPAIPEVVWADVSHLASHVEWMADAESIEFLSVQTAGPGVRMRVATKVGPFRTSDVMEVTGWDPPRIMAVTHQGLITGTGKFVLEPIEAGTRFRWEEDIRFPRYLGGPIGAWVARPILSGIWRRNLRRLAARFA